MFDDDAIVMSRLESLTEDELKDYIGYAEEKEDCHIKRMDGGLIGSGVSGLAYLGQVVSRVYFDTSCGLEFEMGSLSVLIGSLVYTFYHCNSFLSYGDDRGFGKKVLRKKERARIKRTIEERASEE